jgi:hypothetical protein
VIAFSQFWQGYCVGGLAAAIGGPTIGHWIVSWIKEIPWRVRVERKDARA